MICPNSGIFVRYAVCAVSENLPFVELNGGMRIIMDKYLRGLEEEGCWELKLLAFAQDGNWEGRGNDRIVFFFFLFCWPQVRRDGMVGYLGNTIYSPTYSPQHLP